MSESEEERRPRPIGVADDSEDSDVERGNDTSAGASARTGDGPAIETTGAAAPEEGAAKKPSKRMPAFSENDLVKEKGLRQIYKDFPRKCQYKGKGREAEFLRGLMVAYREWGYQLYPGVAFEDLASRTEKLGGKARTRDLMHELRDTERDRVIEAKYGRAAVEDVRAQEAAKLAAKESKTTAAEEDEAEEREDEELAGSRYMEVDEGAAAGGAAAAASEEAASAAVISEQVRQRMEVNRRLALERLRKKKEEAAAAAAALEKENDHGAAGAVSMDYNGGGGEMMDPMDVDEGAAGDDIDNDDEDALADMEAEARADGKTVTGTGAATSAGVAAAAADDDDYDAASTPVAPAPSATSEGVTDTAHSNKDKQEGTSSAYSSPRRKDEAAEDVNSKPSDDIADGMADGVVGRGNEGAAGQSVEGGGGGGGGDVNGAARKAPNTAAGGNVDSDSAPPEASGGEDRCRAQDQEDETQREAAAAMSVDETVGGSRTLSDAAEGDDHGDDGRAAEDIASARRDEHAATFSSPVKGKAAGGLPLSPLGNLFANTDVSAEGGTAAVRAPLAGLFSDENA